MKVSDICHWVHELTRSSIGDNDDIDRLYPLEASVLHVTRPISQDGVKAVAIFTQYFVQSLSDVGPSIRSHQMKKLFDLFRMLQVNGVKV